MQVTLIKIGNSKGVRLPKAVIDQACLEDKIELEVRDGQVILSSTRQPRRDWGVSAQACHEAGEDRVEGWDETLEDFEGSW